MITLLSGDGFRAGVEGLYIIDFAVFVFALWWFLRRPVQEFTAARRARITSEMEEAKRLRQEAEAKLTEYEQRLANLEVEVQAILDEARQAGEEQRKQILLEATRSAERLRQDSRSRLEQETRKLLHELRLRMVDLSVEVAEKLVTEQITDAHRRRFVGEYIEDLEGRQGQL